MKKHELDALRDFAIEHLPAAQRQREKAQRFGMDLDGYCRALSVAAMLTQTNATVSAIEGRAARLLEQLMLLALDHGYEGIETTIIEATHDLASLTSTTIPWLPAIRIDAPAPAQPANAPAQTSSLHHETGIADLRPGEYLTTEQAAFALGYEPNTLRTWASKQSGPIQPAFKVSRQHRWRTDDILELIAEKNRKRN